MASAPQPQLPLFYKDLLPLNSRDHSDWKVGTMENAAVSGPNPCRSADLGRIRRRLNATSRSSLPLAKLRFRSHCFGLNEGVNTFIGEDQKLVSDVYVPGYVRRYPFILARLRQDSDEMSLCFDPTVGVIGKHERGYRTCSTRRPSRLNIPRACWNFCRRFEEAPGSGGGGDQGIHG